MTDGFNDGDDDDGVDGGDDDGDGDVVGNIVDSGGGGSGSKTLVHLNSLLSLMSSNKISLSFSFESAWSPI